MERKRLSLMNKVDILLRQSLCPLCQQTLANSAIEWDHAVPLALGGEDSPGNIRAVHTHCHATKTLGPSKATAAGGDIHKAAKTKRLSKQQEAFRQRLLTKGEQEELTRPKRSWPSRPFPKKVKHDRPAR